MSELGKMLKSVSKGKKTKGVNHYCTECKSVTEHLKILDQQGDEFWCKVCGQPYFD